jgi:hypothetical protein
VHTLQPTPSPSKEQEPVYLFAAVVDTIAAMLRYRVSMHRIGIPRIESFLFAFAAA